MNDQAATSSSEVENKSHSKPSDKRGAAWRLGLFVGAIAVLAGLAFVFREPLATIFDEFEPSPTAVAIFVLLYAALTVAMVPGTVGSVAAGAIFGLWLGFVAAFSGAVIGALVAFLIARKAGRSSVEALLRGKLASFDEFLGDNQFVAFLTLRLLPIVPFNAFNYGAGLSAVSFKKYLLTTAIGIAPGSFVLVAVGGTASDPTGLPFVLAVTTFALLTVGGGVFARRYKSA